MTVFRWIVGVIAALMISGMSLSFVVYIASGVDVWVVRARRFRHWAYLALLLWFNVEIWLRVALIIIHW